MRTSVAVTTVVILITGILSAGCGGIGQGSDMPPSAPSGSSPADDAKAAYEGHDPVAFFAAEKAVRGNSALSFAWNGATYLFSSAENLEAFKASPEKYIAQFGEYCPVSLSRGESDRGSPTAWRVYKEKLYFFVNEDLAKEFDKDPEKILESARGRYEEIGKHGGK